jgi:hypothetical protein
MLSSRKTVLVILLTIVAGISVLVNMLPSQPDQSFVTPDADIEARLKDLEVESSTAVTPITITPAPKEEPELAPVQIPADKGSRCRASGCSGQLCTDRGDQMTTCEWREEYACYHTAVCERQPTGECGWTETPELKSCLLNPSTVGETSI